MMTRIDSLLDRVTMYRLVLYALLGYVGIAALLAAFGRLPFAPLALLASAAFLVALCWAANIVLSWAFDAPANVESAAITALILALIFDPARSPDALPVLGWAAIVAMASKYVLAWNQKHIFNPAALAAVISSFLLGNSASWWVGTAGMLPFALLGGVLVVRKIRQEEMVGAFLGAALVTVVLASLLLRLDIAHELQQLLVESPLVFFASIMLTEPLTAPPTRTLKWIYGALVGFLAMPQIHLGVLYSTPELALLAGNVFAYAVSPKQRVTLRLKRRSKLSADVVDFAFAPSRQLAFVPGQYMEVTLAHPGADSRGNRRYFTLASSPTEEDVRLGVRFYRRGSSYKRAMWGLDARTRVIGTQIAGDFTLPRDPRRKLVLIAGGIGITPFRSMLKYLVDTGQRRDIVLLWANRSADDVVYRDVLAEAHTKLGVKTVLTLTDDAAIPRGWSGAVGRIDARLIAEAAPDYRERTFYVSGPPDMVRATEHALRALGVSRRRVRKDFFPGLV